MKKIAMGALLCAGLLALAGCGGGGDEDEVPSTSFNVQAAFENTLTTEKTWELTGELDGNGFEMTVEFEPTTSGTFPPTGESGSRVIQSITVTAGGVTLLESSGTVVFDPADFRLIGQINGPTCEVGETQEDLPADALVGDEGLHTTSRVQEVCGLSASTDQSIVTRWSLTHVDDDVFYCSEATLSNGAGVVIGVTTVCFEINEAGTLGDKASVRIEAEGEVVEAAN